MVQCALKVCGQRRANVDRLTAEGMSEGEACGVQELALEPEDPRRSGSCDPGVPARWTSVLRITHDRVTDGLQVNADLVRASGVQVQTQEREVTEGALDLEVSAGLARVRAVHGHAGADARVASDGRLDRAGAGGRATVHEREVLAHDVPLRERLLQATMGLVRACDDEQTGGVAIEAMDDAGALGIGPSGDSGAEQLGERAGAMPARGVNHEAGGLVDDEQLVIFVGDRETVGHGDGG